MTAGNARTTSPLDALADFVDRYVVLPTPEARDAFVLWPVHTFALDAFDSTPRLALLSAEKASGKTRGLELLELMTANPLHVVNVSEASLFRMITLQQPTLLFDEADTYFGPAAAKKNEGLRGLVNAGHRRGARAMRCDPTTFEPQSYQSFAAVAMAGIGNLPETILDRSVIIRMKRRKESEHIENYREAKVRAAAEPLRDALAAWAGKNLERIREHEPEMPPGLVDRPADVWEPLLKVADVAGGDWPARARTAAIVLNNERAASDTSLGVRLLRDIKVIFDTDHANRLTTRDLLAALATMLASPWGDMALTDRAVAKLLAPYEVHPRKIRIGESTLQGYTREAFADAWERYLPRAATPSTADAFLASVPVVPAVPVLAGSGGR